MSKAYAAGTSIRNVVIKAMGKGKDLAQGSQVAALNAGHHLAEFGRGVAGKPSYYAAEAKQTAETQVMQGHA